MRKTFLHIMILGATAGALLWNTPGNSYASVDEDGSSVILTPAEALSSIAVLEEATATGEDSGETTEVSQTAETVAAAEADEEVAAAEEETVEIAQAESGDEEAVSEVTQSEQTGASGAEAAASDVRQEVVNFALSFVGGRYRDGGTDPHSGVDCSGFVRYVMQYGAGVSLNRSSASQANQGIAVHASQMQPGDLIFYSNGSRINHVAMYIGAGQVVHASTERTGIKTSPWNYRTPARIINVLG